MFYLMDLGVLFGFLVGVRVILVVVTVLIWLLIAFAGGRLLCGCFTLGLHEFAFGLFVFRYVVVVLTEYFVLLAGDVGCG